MNDIYAFTDAEWEASFWGMPASEFKGRFFDKMDLKGIMYVIEKLPDMDYFMENMTLDDWRRMTVPEWEAFMLSSDIEELVDFIHDMHRLDRHVIVEMFKHMPQDLLADFRDSPELGHEFSRAELETIRRGVEKNHNKKQSLYDEDLEFDGEVMERKGKNSKGKGKKNGPGKKGPKKNGPGKERPPQKGPGKKGPKKNGPHAKPEGGHQGPKPNKPMHEQGPKKHQQKKMMPEDREFEHPHNRKGKNGRKGGEHPKHKHEKPEKDEAYAWILDNEEAMFDFEGDFDYMDELREEMRVAEFEAESEYSTREDSESSSNSNSNSESNSDSSSSNSSSAFGSSSNSESDSDIDSDSDSESDSNSDSSSSEEDPIVMMKKQKMLKKKAMLESKKEHIKAKKELKKARKQKKKQRKANKKQLKMDDSESVSSSEGTSEGTSDGTSESSSEELFLPALPEDVKPLNFAQQSIDKRHGGRHLHRGGRRGRRDSSSDSSSSESSSEVEFMGQRHDGVRGEHRRGGRHEGPRGGAEHRGRRGGRHGGRHGGHRGGHMKWCLAIGATLYAAILATFVGVFKKFVNTFRSYHRLNEVH